MPSFSSRPPLNAFLAYYNELVGTWTRKLRNRHDAEDVAHDAVLQMLEVEGATILQPRAYLHQTARNVVTDAYRRSVAHETVPLDTIDDTATGDHDPVAMLCATEMVHALEGALNELPLKCRQVFVWQRLDGLTQSEIALRLNISKNMVEKYMIRTMRHLRVRLAALNTH
ncbi:sigma-70 family RNA polymerase sigma factor [Nitrosospira sp. NpAV]|uniref:sigma-70 family RNA polymerase sigma factor n=1 Tax=Nitrosospira sp. NpAV TaxID=58133 RepID=UPI0005A26359|nr:sigma-70 family RNA polymerase sigma factor [Nitrosospira sp. NpAV]KIO47874.1 RNA polymerase subunit sigma-24 [Nitrosospira sp. NpAV]